MLHRIRLAALADLPRLCEIETRCFTSDIISRRQWRYLLTQARAAVLVTTQGEQVSGAAVLLTPSLPRPARLYSLAVAPSWRRRGVGTLLLDQVLALAVQGGYGELRLEVQRTNPNAIRLYQANGFVAGTILPQYYSDGTDGLRMCKKLGG